MGLGRDNWPEREARRRAIAFAMATLLLAALMSGCRVAQLPPHTFTPVGNLVSTPTRPMPSILLGAAVDSDHLLNDSQYRATLQSNFSLVVPENELKFEATEPAQGAFDFSRGDALINFAHEHGMWVRGHTLVWGEHLPTWLTAGQFTRDQVIDILRNHIQTVVRHYRGNLISWDVVNEPFDGNYLRDTFWMHTIGPDYIAMAFKWAHEADPDAKLFLNDFGDDEIGPKFDAIYHLVTTLRSQGVPINGVGMEMHIGFGAPADPHAVSINMSRLKAAGLEVAVTEIDVQTSKLPGTMDDKLREQATIYGAMAAACRQAGNCHAFVSWGVTDRLTWLTQTVGPHEAPLLFDENYQPKPAFFAVKDALYGSGTPARLTPTP